MNKIKALCIGISLCSISLNAQNTWNGSTTNTTTNGNVGIGTTNPVASLEIWDQNAQLILQSTGKPIGVTTQFLPSINLKTSTRNFFIGTEYVGPNNEILRIRDLGNINGGGITFLKDKVYLGARDGRYYDNIPSDVVLGKTWAENLAIGGKFASDSKLSVSGKATFEEAEVKLSTLWPDYVFASNYNLAPLDSVETFIQKNSHLPNVPSAQEVSEKGINLGNMDAVLLQKIEELTLYNIQMHKQMEAMKAEIATLKEN
jgi:hypothetical protein